MSIILHYADERQERAEGHTWAEARAMRDERLREFNAGDRVRLVALAVTVVDGVTGWDDRETLPPGSLGTVEAGPPENAHVDDAGTLWVRWDNGHRLGATADDVIEKVVPPPNTG